MLDNPNTHEHLEPSEDFGLESTSSEHKELAVTEANTGQRLDRFLAAHLPEMSRTHVQLLIEEGRVRVDGVAKKPSHHVEIGDTVTVEIPPPPIPGVQAEDIPLEILYEDADIAVVNKPAGMIVHPGAGAASLRQDRRALYHRQSSAPGHRASN